MRHCAWGGECHADAMCVCCFLLRGMVVWCRVFLYLRLYALMCMWEVRRYLFGGSLFVFIVLLVCSARVVELGAVSVGRFMVWATCWLCCVFSFCEIFFLIAVC